MQTPKQFNWSIVQEKKKIFPTIVCQAQYSSNTGSGNGRCGTGK